MATSEGKLVVGWISEAARNANLAQNDYGDADDEVNKASLAITIFGETPARNESLRQANAWRARAGGDVVKALNRLNAAIRAYVDWYPSDDLGVEIKEVD